MRKTAPLSPPETQIVSTYRVCCDGGEGALGHPRVWMPIPHDVGWVDCGYCDKRFVHADHVAQHEAYMAALAKDDPAAA
ncbi:zinc-finger domain-containing protein [Plastorhodobacter daqingensis]|uniref:Zinc-finger domain-containing protein n=1 Tax=Plastorhodobacter daqingensis TaxID=1387281 RepID=A0ABW2UIH9_9RHOB